MFIITKQSAVAALAILVLAAAMLYASIAQQSEGAEAYKQPKIATSTVSIAGPQTIKTLFAARSDCGSRNITTSSSSIMLSFNSDLLTPSLSAGHWQAASTTKEYDAEQWGCQQVTVYGIASTSVTLSEARF